MDHELRQVEGKRQYDPPRLTNISLRPEEAVLGHCKTSSGGGNSTFASCQPIGICNNTGS
jgi:hypothetical protein